MRLIAWWAVPAACLIGGAAFADTRTLARQGVWEAYGGVLNNRFTVCGLSTERNDQSISIDAFPRWSSARIQLGSPSWKFPDGIKVRVNMQVGEHMSWQSTATGFHFTDGEAGLEYSIRRTEFEEFLAELGEAGPITITFPDLRLPSWTANLQGADSVVAAFANCHGRFR